MTVSHKNDPYDYNGEAIIVMLSNYVRNPSSTKPSKSFSVVSELRDQASGEYYMVDRLDNDVKVVANKANEFSLVRITRSNEEVSSFTSLEVCLTTSNDAPADSQLTIMYP